MNKALWAGVSAVAMIAISNGASAQVILKAGGGTTAAKVFRDVFNCYAAGVSGGIILNTSATSTQYQAAYTLGTPAIDYPTELSPYCASAYTGGSAAVAVDYVPVGSGAGQKAFTYYSPASWGLPAVSNPVAWLSDALGITDLAIAESEFDFSGSDTGLSTAQISSAQTTTHGQVIQFPAFVTPIDITVNTAGSSVSLKTSEICGIFGGTITAWSGVAKHGKNTGAITVAVRADSAGASYILSNYLSLVCPEVSSTFAGFTASNGFPSNTPNWSAAAAANGGTTANFVSASGAGGVSSYVNVNPNSITYVSPDYVGAAGGNADTEAASVQYPNATLKYAKPSGTGASILAGGVTEVPTSAYNWGQPLNNAMLAQNLPLSGANFPAKAYPIAGYTFIETYECPAHPTETGALFRWMFNANTGYKFLGKYLKPQGYGALPSKPTNYQSYVAQLVANIGASCD